MYTWSRQEGASNPKRKNRKCFHIDVSFFTHPAILYLCMHKQISSFQISQFSIYYNSSFRFCFSSFFRFFSLFFFGNPNDETVACIRYHLLHDCLYSIVVAIACHHFSRFCFRALNIDIVVHIALLLIIIILFFSFFLVFVCFFFLFCYSISFDVIQFVHSCRWLHVWIHSIHKFCVEMIL